MTEKKAGEPRYSRISFLLFFVLIITLSLVLIWPFVPTILAGLVVAFIFFPVYRKVNAVLKRNVLSAILVSLMVVLVFTIPTILALDAVYTDVAKTLIISKQRLSTTLFGDDCTDDSIACDINQYIADSFNDPKTKDAIYASLSRFSFTFLNSIPDLIAAVPRIILNLFIMLFVMFYVFKDGEKLEDEIRALLPFSPMFNNRLITRTKSLLHATVYGALIVALVQGVLATIAFFLFDSVDAPILWGLLLAFSALVPFVGTALIWLPVGLLQIFNGFIQNSPSIFWKGVGVLLFGTFVISTIDNIIKPRIIGNRSDLHPVLVLVGIFGGIALFGFVGIIVGPLILSILMSFIEVYKETKHEILS